MSDFKSVRGDTLKLCFQRRDSAGNVILTAPDEMYFTLKKNCDTSKVICQKKLSDFTMDNDGTWHVMLRPQDTETLPYGTYAYDIEVTYLADDYVFTIADGEIELTKEATWSDNK